MEDILGRDLPWDEMEVPEWGGWIKVRAITSAELSRAKREATRTGGVLDEIRLQAIIIEKACLEPKMEFGAHRKLVGREAGVIGRVSNRILDLSGIDMEEEEADLDDLGEA
jgi:hypothetical protein